MDFSINSGIYQIRNIINNKVYTGKARNLLRRYKEHIWALNLEIYNSREENPHLWNSWKKYGETNFVFEVVEECSKEELPKREKYWTSLIPKDLRYNILEIDDEDHGWKYPDKVREKISNSNKGKAHLPHTQETKDKISKTLKGRKWHRNSDESYEKRNKTNMERFGGFPTRKSVKQLDKDTNEILNTFNSITEASRLTRIRLNHIQEVCKFRALNIGNRHSAGGFYWEYNEE